MALFELTELASAMQSDLDTSSATLAREIATALVEQVTGPIEARTSTVTLPPFVDGTVELPAGPVTAVTAVTVDAAAADYVWQRPQPCIRLTDWDPPAHDEWKVAVVTFTHGYPVVPPLAKAVALQVAARAYTLPSSPPPGVSVQIDDYRESTSAAGASAEGAAVTLTAHERRALESLSMSSAVVTGS